jgi:hypothetical protein
MNNMEK